jgi:hypothetical protein
MESKHLRPLLGALAFVTGLSMLLSQSNLPIKPLILGIAAVCAAGFIAWQTIRARV